MFQLPLSRIARRRSAFTLLELVLVLALIVAISALAVPSFRGAMATWRLKSAADQIRAAWNRTRADSIRDGEVYVFRFLPRSNHYIAAPWPDGSELPLAVYSEVDVTNDSGPSDLTRGGSADLSRQAPPSPPPSQQVTPSNGTVELPDDVMFFGVSFTAQPGADETIPNEQADESTVPNDGWSEPILFFPDGTSSAARLYLNNDREQFIDVTLRAMTGTSRVGEIQSLDDLQR